MAASIDPVRARSLAKEAYTYGFAIVENYRAIFGMCVWKDSPQYSGFNTFLHGRILFDADYDLVVNANNDTLYSTTFADLRAEPIVITVPPTGDRYFVIQLVDMGTDNFAYIGTRATGRDGGEFLLVGPSFKGALPDLPGVQVIEAPSQLIALATRTAVDGNDDLPGVIAIQDNLLVRPLSAYLGTEPPAPVEYPPFPAFDPNMYGTPTLFTFLNALLPLHTIPTYETELLRRLSAINVGPYQTFDSDVFSADVRAAIEAGAAEAHREIEERGNSLGTVREGWQDVPPMGT